MGIGQTRATAMSRKDDISSRSAGSYGGPSEGDSAHYHELVEQLTILSKTIVKEIKEDIATMQAKADEADANVAEFKANQKASKISECRAELDAIEAAKEAEANKVTREDELKQTLASLESESD